MHRLTLISSYMPMIPPVQCDACIRFMQGDGNFEFCAELIRVIVASCSLAYSIEKILITWELEPNTDQVSVKVN
jgi:hypothetical protein